MGVVGFVIAFFLVIIIRDNILMKNERFKNFVNNKYVKILAYSFLAVYVIYGIGIYSLVWNK